MDKQALARIARKTLERQDSDNRPISAIYLLHLKHLLARHDPQELDFYISLDDGAGSVKCLHCDQLIPPGNGTPDLDGIDVFGSLSNYEKHIQSSSHRRNMRQTSLTPVKNRHTVGVSKSPTTSKSAGPPPGVEVIDVDADFELIRPPQTEFSKDYGVGGPSDAGVKMEVQPLNGFASSSSPFQHSLSDYSNEFASPSSHGVLVKQENTPAERPDFQLGATSAYASSSATIPQPDVTDVDADHELALRIQQEFDAEVDQLAQRPHYDTYQLAAEPRVSTNYGASASASNSILWENIPLEESYNAQLYDILGRHSEESGSCMLYREGHNIISARCSICNYSVALPGSGSLELCFEDVMQSLGEYETHLSSPFHLRRKQEAAQAQAIPLAYNPHGHSPVLPEPYSATGKRKLPGSWSDYGDADTNSAYGSFGHNTEANPELLSSTGYARERVYQDPGLDMECDWSRVWGTNPGHALANLNTDPVQQQQQQTSFLHRAASHVIDAVAPVVQQAHGMVQNLQAQYAHRPVPKTEDLGLNFDEDGTFGRIDRSGPDGEKRFKEFLTKAMDEFKDAIPVNEAQVKLNLKTQDDVLPGLRVRLLPHQIVGVAWMLEQERHEEKHGGILADAMGIGKTVQMLGAMVMNRPEIEGEDGEIAVYDGPQHRTFTAFYAQGKGKDDLTQLGWKPERRTTLVLAPASLLQQWYEEILDKTEPGIFRAHVHHGKEKLKTAQEVAEYDVIITTYQTLNMDFPKVKKKKDPKGKKKAVNGSDSEAEEGEGSDDSDTVSDSPNVRKRQSGVLAKVKWYRVVIDEAQNIRNRSTRISINCAKLDAVYRWCLTGTPITNTLADIYGFLRFCHFEPWNDWAVFNQQVARLQKRNPNRAGRKAQTILKRHLLRRTKDTQLDGKPILQLGPKTIDMIELEFTPDEREMYKRIETKQKQTLSRFFKEGTVMKNYAFILVMILRLRQLCCHPNLLLAKGQDGQGDDEVIDEKTGQNEFDRAMKEMGADRVKNVQARFRTRAENRMKAEQGSIEMEAEECSICFEPLVANGRVTGCGHEFCSDCLNECLRTAEGAEAGEEGAQCPICRTAIDRKRIFKSAIFEPSDEDLEIISRSIPNNTIGDASHRPPKRLKLEDKFLDLTLDDPHSPSPSQVISSENIVDSSLETMLPSADSDNDFEPSTKMLKLLEILQRWRKEAPDEKIIIYSQWTSMLDLVSTYLGKHQIESIRYDGKMNRMARVDAVNRFKRPNGPLIMMISLKCGGVGLNLTVANRVINLDLAWNFATEAQAYDRVHRLGQHKPVSIQRIIVRDTIEERIIRLQGRKQDLSDAALGEGNAGKIKKMTAKEIAELFDMHM